VKLPNEPRLITYPAGIDSASCKYNLNLSWTLGNANILLQWEGNDPNINQRMLDFNKNATYSKALGFNFDATPVQTQIASVQNVINQYRDALECGVTDPKTEVPKFQADLKAAGLDDVIAEKQKQLDAWAKAEGLY
jgi:putative aldouronate transport system substrate-binding protein